MAKGKGTERRLAREKGEKFFRDRLYAETPGINEHADTRQRRRARLRQAAKNARSKDRAMHRRAAKWPPLAQALEAA